MSNKRSQKVKGGCPRGSLQWNQTQVHITLKLDAPKCSKPRCSEASYLELEAERESPVPSREASGDHSEVASNRGIQDQGDFNFQQDQAEWSGTHSRIMIEWILGEDIAC